MKRSQTERIAARLRHAGRTTQHEWIAPTVDGGSQIFRLPARIDELRKRGYEIRTTRRAGRVALYTLVGTPAPAAAAHPAPDGALFDDGIGHAPPACAVHGEVDP